MWFGGNPPSSDNLEISHDQDPQGQVFRTSQEAVQSIFNSNKCYELMPTSCKIIIFESGISFQLAFYALIEHDAEVAPIWDPAQKTFVGLMTTVDFIEALRLYHAQGVSLYELGNRSITDILSIPKPLHVIKHNNFLSVDAESSVYQMCCLLDTLNSDFVPIIDSKEKNIVGALGYLDILYLLAHCAQQFQLVAVVTIDQLTTLNITENLTVSKSTLFHNVLQVLEERQLSCIPITDETGHVIGLYQKSDVAFLSKSNTPDNIISNFSNLQIGEVIQQQNELLSSGSPNFCSCNMNTNMKDLLDSLVNFRVTRAICLDDRGRFVCVVEVRDVLRHFLRDMNIR
eukprot:gene8341-17179_t